MFFDRSPICTLALARHLHHPPSSFLIAEVERIQRDRVYETTVFMVRGLGFVETTTVRRISAEDAAVFEQIHEETYRQLGFYLVDVPPAPVDERGGFILDAVAEL